MVATRPMTDEELDNMSENDLRFLFFAAVLNGQINEADLPKEVAKVVNDYKVVYTVSKKSWADKKTEMLSSKSSFDAVLKSFLRGDEKGKVVFVLPYSVSEDERQRIHTFFKNCLVSGVSGLYNGKRIMKIVLEEPFVRTLMGK